MVGRKYAQPRNSSYLEIPHANLGTDYEKMKTSTL